MTHYIYTLIDPRSGKPFYVGQSKHPERRLKEHIYLALQVVRDHLDARGRCIRDILASGQLPALAILEATSAERIDSAEFEWFARLIAEGAPLLNTPQFLAAPNALYPRPAYPRTPFLSINDCSRRGGVTRSELKAAIRAGKLRAVKVGRGTYLMHEADFRAWLAQSRRGSRSS